jgi:hypothetical protein
LSMATALTDANGIATAPVLKANGQTGSFTVSASCAGAGSSAIFNLTNLAPAPVAGVGLLTGIGDSSSTAVNLTAQGTTDWVHWGDGFLTRKAGVNPQISDYTLIGTGPVFSYTNDPRSIGWTDGVPIPGATNNNGLYVNFQQNGFAFTVPAGNSTGILSVHVGGWFSAGTFTAHLSDQSAPDFIDTTNYTAGQYDRNYTLTYNAASAGQTLTISWVVAGNGSNVTLNGAALSLAAGTSSAKGVNNKSPAGF